MSLEEGESPKKRANLFLYSHSQTEGIGSLAFF